MKMNELREKSVAICGFRRYGRKLYEDLKKNGTKIVYILERNVEALEILEWDLDTPIIGFDRGMDLYGQADVLLITPDMPGYVVEECLTLAEIDVERIFMDASGQIASDKEELQKREEKVCKYPDVKEEAWLKWKDRKILHFKDCSTDKERCEYKADKMLQQENDEWMKKEHPNLYKKLRIGTYAEAFDVICQNIKIPDAKERFVHFVDHRFLFDTTRGYRFENITPDYERWIRHGFAELKYPESEVSNKFCEDYNSTLDSLASLAMRIARHYEEAGKEGTEHTGWLVDCFKNMRDKPTSGFADALQRILFIDQMFWQTGHRLMGLGHLDRILWDVYKKDRDSGQLTRELAVELLCDFFQALHRCCWLKSNLLLGDTGQIIILGDKGEQGKWLYNELTELFLEAAGRVHLPDPKLMLRVGADTPDAMFASAIRCMQEGTGSPILANDDVIMPSLLEFGVRENDARHYGVAACWEPLIPGGSISPNNMKVISFPLVMRNALYRDEAKECGDLEEWMKLFDEELQKEIGRLEGIIDDFRFQYNPLLSIATDSCYQKKCDVSAGGADYCSCGFTTVGLSNTVNAIFNLKKLVFDEHKYTLMEIRQILENNYEGDEELCEELRRGEPRYGMDDEKVIQLANSIMRKASAYLGRYHNYFGGRFKLGVSAPAYIDSSRDEPASLDGRKKGEPFGVHISSESGNGYTELLHFASQLDYKDNRFNGNVADIMVSPDFIKNNFEKMTMLVKAAIRQGVFEFQMNVVGSDTLIAAKERPEKYPNLVVRVWGFSALFVELPEAYQNVLIHRALENGGKGMKQIQAKG